MRPILLGLLLSFCLPALPVPFASLVASAEPEELPVDPGIQNRGYELAPVLKCPAVPEAYARMITQLNLLKTAIKKDAACEPLNEEVKGLEELLGKERSEVRELIEKSKKEALSAEELARVRSYVEDVTKKVLATAELFNRNNYCFVEDKKNISFSDLASITLDATALLKTISGPWATPISLGGQALAGIFQGLNTVVKSRRGYDFTKLESRQSYVQSLCAYYNYRQDIENLLYPDRRAQQLRGLEALLKSHLQGIVQNCAECGSFAHKVQLSLSLSSGPQDRSRRGPKKSLSLNAEAVAINSLYVRPLGTYTVKTLSTLSWIQSEIKRLREENDENSAIGRDFLSEIKVDIDRFLFEREAPQFVRFQSQKGYDLFREFHAYVAGEAERLQAAAIAAGLGSWEDLSRLDEGEALRKIAAFREPALAKGQLGLASRITGFQKKGLELYERTRIAAGVTETYCAFFQRGGVYGADLQYACEGMAANALRRNLQRLNGSSFLPQPALPAVPPVEYVTDWVDSLSRVVSHIQSDPARYQRRAAIILP